MKRLVYPFLAILLAVMACGTPTPMVPTAGPSPAPATPASNPDFTIGVEYAILGVAPAYAAIGVTYAKLQNVFALWGNIQPVEGGPYEWGPLDALVGEYQEAGFSGLQMDLSALSPWASSIQPTLGNPGDSFPKEEFLDDYSAFVGAVVERYDRDGQEDMPGLLYPIHDYGVEREFTGFWPGSADEYVRLLHSTTPAVKAADDQAHVLLAALLMTDVFDGNPGAEEIRQRLTQNADYMRKSVPEIRTILAACDAYDSVDFHSLGDYTEIPLTSAWIRQELQTNGCGDRPIWIGDAFPMSALIAYGGFVPPRTFAPATPGRRDQVIAILTSAADPADGKHAEALAWLYAEMARNLVRKIVVSAGENLRGINLGNMEDWGTGSAALDKAAVPLLGASMFMGMTDTTLTNRQPGGGLPFNGQGWSKARLAGTARPDYYALKLVMEKISAFSSVEKLALGSGTWAYHFERPTGPAWVLWYDDGKLYLPNEVSPTATVTLPFGSASAFLTWTPTDPNQAEAETRTVAAPGGNLTFNLGGTPIFIEEAR